MKKYILIACLLLNTAAFLHAQCGTDEYSDNEFDTWESCEMTTNPNSVRGEGHWILYDFGYIYELGTSHVWNANEMNNTGIGMKDVMIDYSVDGVVWESWGQFQFNEATGQNNYTGDAGPDLTGLTARYVIITAVSTWDNTACAGLAELRINVNGIVSNVNNIKDTGSFTISPNPTSKQINLSFKDTEAKELIISSSTGQEMRRIANANGIRTIDVSALLAGYYIVTIVTKDNVYLSQSFVKI